MLRRGLAFSFVMGMASVANAGAVITLVPTPQAACYTPGQQVTVEVRLTQNAGGVDHYLRYTQLDLSQTTASLLANVSLPITHDLVATDIRFWNFSGVPICTSPTHADCGKGHYIEDTLPGVRPNVISRTYFFTDPGVLGTNTTAQPLLKGDGTPLVLGRLNVTMPGAGNYTLNVLNATQANADLGGADVRFGFGSDAPIDPVTKWHAGTADLTGGTLAFTVQTTPCTPTCANLVGTHPLDNQSLWRTAKNIIRLRFDGTITAPTATQIQIRDLIAGTGSPCANGTFGANVASGFTFTVENVCVGGANVGLPCANNAACPASTCGTGNGLKIQETATTLVHRKWYEISNLGTLGQPGAWPSACSFGVGGDGPAQFVVQMGDANNDGRVNTLDGGAIYPFIPCVSGCGDARRQDVNGDQRINTIDPAQVFPKIPSLPVTKPCGH